ncbi:MAG: fibrobacter succinogenes major paralogous domain-containing protein [Ignavibacteria bacterium]|jgi:uncharacterized protein (TIGR02145 family)
MNQTYKIQFSIFITVIFISLCFANSFSQVTDKDGNTYKTVKIGNQEWMSENLNVEHYRNGDEIPQVQDKEEWDNLTTGAWCYYDNTSENGTTYGKIYNWYAVNDPRGIAPEGWHVATDEDWTKLTDFLGGAQDAGTKLKSSTGWIENYGGNNSSGFTALPGGYRTHDGYFSNMGKNAIFWTSTEYNPEQAWFRNVIGKIPDVYRPNYGKDFGLSIRCIKD